MTAARSWVAHLRSGGTTPWLEWLAGAGEATGPAPEQPADGPLPGAAQLELVRRMAARPAATGHPGFTALADRALRRSGPGRGLPHLPLLVPGESQQPRYGAPPTDPATVPAEELLRVGVGLLVELLLEGEPAAEPAPAPRRKLFARPFHLAGAPITTARVRDALASTGHVEGGRRPTVLLFAEPLDVTLAQVWSARVQRGAPVRWVTFAGRWARRDQLPPSAELVRIAEFWAGRVGPERVHVVAGTDPRRTTEQVLGLRVPDAAPVDPRSLAPAGVDLLRRVNRVLNVRVAEDRRAGYLRRLAGLLPADPAPVLDLPAEHRVWLDDRAHGIGERLRAGGYAVHGDLDRIAPRHEGAPHPRRLDVLDLVLDTSLRWAEHEA